MFWYSTAGLLALATFFILLPMRRLYKPEHVVVNKRKDANIDLYREQLRELREEWEAGDIDQRQFDSLQAELHRKLLADVAEQVCPDSLEEKAKPSEDMAGISNAEEDEGKEHPGSRATTNKIVPFVLALVIPVLAYGLYSQWGYYDEVKLSGLFRQAIHNVNDPKVSTTLVKSLKEAVSEDEDNQWAWYFLGKNYFTLGLYEQSKEAFQHSIRYMEGESDQVMVMGQFVLASFMHSGRTVTEETRAMIDRALAINPSDQTVLRVLASDARKREDFPNAITYWRKLIRANPASSAARVYQSNITAAERILSNQNAGAEATKVREGTIETEGAAAVRDRIDVNVSLAQGITLPAEFRVFVAARNAARKGLPPLAAVDLKVAQLPAKITLDKSSAVGPFDLSSADTVYVSALVSFSGVATPKQGDYRVISETFALNGTGNAINLVISERVP
ncbi:MAG: c-type cytochrome biogenesis protein CcmI [Gammaproteobacteria bacterium]|nr:c-type cytochrome biogenesis protein CcmI [Gammaproteobacteria bacterium]